MLHPLRTALGLILMATLAWADQGGRTDARTGAPGESTCISCHSSFPLNSGPSQFRIQSPPFWRPGQSLPITVQWVGSPYTRHGFEVTAMNPSNGYVGAFAALDGNTRVGGTGNRYGTHTTTGSSQAQWTLNWTAPAAVTPHVTFYAAGIDCSVLGGTSGDYVHTTNLRFAVVPLLAQGTPNLGATVTLALNSGTDAGRSYVMAASLGNSGVSLPGGRILPLAPDTLFFLTVTFGGLPPYLTGFVGVLNAQGSANATAVIPTAPAFVGVTLHFAYVVIDPAGPGGFGTISNDESVTVVP